MVLLPLSYRGRDREEVGAHTHTADRAAANLKQTLVEVQWGVAAGCAPVEALQKDKAVCTLSWLTHAYTHTLG